MTYEELISTVKLAIQDDSFTDAIIGDYLNQAQLEIAGGMQSAIGNWITPPLPKLLTIDTITTDLTDPYVDMPDNFHRDLQFVASPSGNEINISNSFISFSETYPLLDNNGSVNECIEFGGKFYYQGIPLTATDITLHYYRLPIDMTQDEDEPDGIPVHLQKQLLCNHAIWKIFELIEDGKNDPGPNTERYMKLFFIALKTLELTIPYENRPFKVNG